MNDFIEGAKKIGSEILDEVGNSLVEVKKSYLDDEFYRGYDKSTNICIRHISYRVDALRKQIKDSKFLSKEDQYLMIQLEELQREIEDRLSRSRINIHAKAVKKDSQESLKLDL